MDAFTWSEIGTSAWWLPPLVAFSVSFFTSMGGVSGAFLILPFQISVLGVTSPSSSATNQLYNVVAIPAGVWRYASEGRMLWPLAWVVAVGTVPGVFVGSLIRVAWLPDPDRFIIFAGLVLTGLGLRMASTVFARATEPAGSGASFQISSIDQSWTAVSFDFADGRHRFGVPAVFAVALVVGVIGGTYGIGGGAIIAPIVISLYRLPVHTVAGASLFATLLTSVSAVVFFHALAPVFPDRAVAPDWTLGLLFGVGGMAGIWLGARAQRFVPARLIRTVLAVVLLGIGATYLIGS
jgi:uncharacterized membrane protein YfcA